MDQINDLFVLDKTQEITKHLGSVRKKEFNRIIDSMVERDPTSSIIQIVLDACSEMDIEPEHASGFLSELNLQRIREEALRKKLIQVEGISVLPGL